VQCVVYVEYVEEPSVAKPATEGVQNLTVQLRKETIQKAKVLAAKKGLSISRLVEEKIEEAVLRDDEYEAAKRRSLDRLEKGFDLGGGPYLRRDEIYDRGR
jgi:hypothetical protein